VKNSPSNTIPKQGFNESGYHVDDQDSRPLASQSVDGTEYLEDLNDIFTFSHKNPNLPIQDDVPNHSNNAAAPMKPTDYAKLGSQQQSVFFSFPTPRIPTPKLQRLAKPQPRHKKKKKN
jgi:hypothetical protein